jgi:hypothetical protein
MNELSIVCAQDFRARPGFSLQLWFLMMESYLGIANFGWKHYHRIHGVDKS